MLCSVDHRELQGWLLLSRRNAISQSWERHKGNVFHYIRIKPKLSEVGEKICLAIWASKPFPAEENKARQLCLLIAAHHLPASETGIIWIHLPPTDYTENAQHSRLNILSFLYLNLLL